MRVMIHDFSGHPGQAHLSRALARRGHQVVHVHCGDFVTGHGRLHRSPDDPGGLSFRRISLGRPFPRYSRARIWHEVRYGFAGARAVRATRPDVLVQCNIPLLASFILTCLTRLSRTPMVFWHQDVYSVGLAEGLAKVFGRRVGGVAGWLAERGERFVARSSRRIVAISDSFEAVHRRWGTSGRLAIIPNWGPVDEIAPRPKDNDWSRQHGLDHRPVVLYAGTIGLKHDETVLRDIGRALEQERPEARLVVVSQPDALANLAAVLPANVILLPLQDYAVLPDVLGSADVLLALLSPEASAYSVPSKVLTYLCAGRCILAVLPGDNLAGHIVREAGAGEVTSPEDAGRTALALLADSGRLRSTGERARAYAEEHFQVDAIAATFEVELERARQR